jgi:hypothetical protein
MSKNDPKSAKKRLNKAKNRKKLLKVTYNSSKEIVKSRYRHFKGFVAAKVVKMGRFTLLSSNFSFFLPAQKKGTPHPFAEKSGTAPTLCQTCSEPDLPP